MTLQDKRNLVLVYCSYKVRYMLLGKLVVLCNFCSSPCAFVVYNGENWTHIWICALLPHFVIWVPGLCRCSDGDGLSDFDEVTKYYTNPISADTDGDGLGDFDEIMK